MRRLIATLSTIVTTIALGVALSSPAAAATGAGTYTSITPYRAVDTRTGVHGNRKGALVSGSFTQVQLDGYVPSSAKAAVVSLTTLGSTSSGALATYAANAAVPTTAALYYRPGTVSTVTAIVPLTDSRLRIRNSGPGKTDVVVDVVGFYGAVGTSGTSGLLTSLPNRRVLSALTVLAPGASRVVSTGFVGTVFLQTHVLNATRNGSLAIYRTNGSVPPTNNVYHGIGTGYSSSTFARTDSSGRVTVVNRGPAAIKLGLDLSATFPGDSTVAANGLQAVAPQRLMPARVIGPGELSSIPVAGRRGVALQQLGAVAVSVIVSAPTTAGNLVVGASGHVPTATRTVSFGAKQLLNATVIVPIVNGAFEIRNGSTGSVQVYVDVLGYLPSNSLTPPAPTASSARYLDDLTRSGVSGGNRSTLRAHGCDDAEAGATFALLDVGAQTHASPLSTANPGVALARTDTDPKVDRTVRLSYAELVEAVKGYLDGAAECATSEDPIRVAVGTNNSGNFSDSSNTANPPYAAGARGTDWFDRVVQPLQDYAASKDAGITVAGANDIENEASQFNAVYLNAQKWEDAYLAAAKGSSDDKLIFNGAANDCPAYFDDTTSVCNEGWTLAQFAALATNQRRVQVLPQIYFASQAAQWTNIAATAIASGKTIDFLGALTEKALAPGEYSADQGWTALNRGLSSVVGAPALPRSVPFVE